MLVKFAQSVGYALQGMKISLAERNMRIHLVAGCLVIFMALYFQVTKIEWMFLLLCIGLVITAELCNTALEKICDAVASQNSQMFQKMGDPKDLGAGAVLAISITAAIIGLIIFIPYILPLIIHL